MEQFVANSVSTILISHDNNLGLQINNPGGGPGRWRGIIDLLPWPAAETSPVLARNVVLVHGLFADGSCWTQVIACLQAAGLKATAEQKPPPPKPEPGGEGTRRAL